MRRFCLILLLLILPFQLNWAVAAAYCQHEEASQSKWHFGHHEHHHQSSTKAGHDKKAVIDTDCGVCHLVSAAMACGQPLRLDTVDRAQTPPVSHALKLTSSSTRAPDRPQWRRLT